MQRGSTQMIRAALLYAALTFACGFVLGAARSLGLEPAIGPVAAVLTEIPVMLALSWLACRFTLRRIHVPEDAIARLSMGAIALLLLLAAEAVLSLTLGGLTLLQHFALYGNPPVQLGLAAQIAFGLFPFLQRRKS